MSEQLDFNNYCFREALQKQPRNTPKDIVFTIIRLSRIHQIQMYKRKDNDIFGTSTLGYAPRIENNSYIDPNAAFKKKMEDNYQNYAAKLTNAVPSITAKPLDSTKVNQKASFEQNYHKARKQHDLQSTIFYLPTPKPVAVESGSQGQSTASSRCQGDMNYGRKETLKREISKLPYNQAQIKGNSSRLFDFDQRVRPKTEQVIPVAPLIPIQMQWDQHDSVKYAHINDNHKVVEYKKVVNNQEIQDIAESKSTYFNQEQLQKGDKANLLNLKKGDVNTLKKAKSQKELKKIQPTKKEKELVEIKVLKGWDYKFMQGLSKQSKLNGTAILKFQAEEAGKATITLKRSQRWENVTDWLRKDAKLKIRVVNN